MYCMIASSVMFPLVALAELLVAFLRRDYRAVAEVQFRERYEAWVKGLRAKEQIEYRDL